MDEIRIGSLCADLPPGILEKTKETLKETDEKILKGIPKLKAFCESENFPAVDDEFLLSFLRVSKFKTGKAKDRLKRYFSMRYNMADFFDAHLDKDMIRRVLDGGMVGVLPYKDHQGRCIFYTRGEPWKPEICSFDNFVATFIILVHFLCTLPCSSTAGCCYLADVKANTVGDYYMFYKYFKNYHSIGLVLPLRLAKIYAMKDNAVCHGLYQILKPLLPRKLTKRLMMFGYDFEALHEEIHPRILHEEFGGTLGPLNNDFFKEQLLDYINVFKAENKIFQMQN